MLLSFREFLFIAIAIAPQSLVLSHSLLRRSLYLFPHQIPLKDALLLHEVLEDHAQDLEDALGMYSKASSGGAVEPVRGGG